MRRSSLTSALNSASELKAAPRPVPGKSSSSETVLGYKSGVMGAPAERSGGTIHTGAASRSGVSRLSSSRDAIESSLRLALSLSPRETSDHLTRRSSASSRALGSSWSSSRFRFCVFFLRMEGFSAKGEVALEEVENGLARALTGPSLATMTTKCLPRTLSMSRVLSPSFLISLSLLIAAYNMSNKRRLMGIMRRS